MYSRMVSDNVLDHVFFRFRNTTVEVNTETMKEMMK